MKPSTEIKHILLLYTDRYYFANQVYPFGLDIIAHHLRRHGYTVSVDYPFLENPDLKTNLERIIGTSKPDLIGLGIRNLDTAISCEPFGDHECPNFRTFYFLPDIDRIVRIIRNIHPRVPMILGGGAFSIAPVPIMKKLEIEYGIVGEGEKPLTRFLEAFPDKEKMTGIENMVFRHKGNYHIHPRGEPYRFIDNGEIFRREKTFNYAYETTGMPVRTKRGCNRTCSYCVEPIIEGRRFSFKNHETVIKELEFIAKTYDQVHNIFITDTEFNIPDLSYCRTLVEKIIAAGLHERFRFSSQFLPRPFDSAFADLLDRAGFSVILTCDSFADGVLEKNRAPHREKDIVNAIELCSRFRIDCTVCLIFGLPGENRETMDHTLEQMRQHPMDGLRRYEYTMGGRIYQGTLLSQIAEKEGRNLYGQKSEGCLDPFYYCSPESPLKLKQYVEDRLPFSMEYKNADNEAARQMLAAAYLVDKKRWDEVANWFFKIALPAKVAIFDYLFRNLSNSGRIKAAKTVSHHLLDHINHSGQQDQYAEQISLIRFYSSLLGMETD